MKKTPHLIFWAIISIATFFQSSQAQILYSQDFEGTGGTMPAGLTIIDGDASPAAANVAAFDQWILSRSTEVALPTIDSVAAVTSWLNPSGTSDDWLITPQVTGITATTNLSWEAVARDPAYPDGYQVWVTSTLAGATPVITDFTTNGTMVFTIAAEDTSFVPHTVSLAAFAGQSIYVGFRNNSTDKFILEIDDIVVENVVALSLSNSSTPANCSASDGTATVTPSGGSAPYTFLWDATASGQTTATATGLIAGTYGVTCTDNSGASITSSVVVADAGIVLYTQDFEGTGGVMPAGLTIIDGDASPAAANVAAFDQWILSRSTEVALPTIDSVAAVTSWLNPSGTSDDWLITPLVSGILSGADLSWEAVARDPAYPDGYQVWVTSTIAGATPVITDFTTNGTMVFSIAAEDTSFVPHTVSLTPFAGQNIYVGFRNNSTDKFILEVDDIVVKNPCSAPALAITDTTTNANCSVSDGTATVIPLGGTAPYTFLWDAMASGQTTATATGLMAGTYGVTCTDNSGASITSSVVVASNGIVLYSQDFEGTGGTMPAGLTIIDGDASPAAANVAAFDQWILSRSTEVALPTIDSVAAVTSWLNPSGTSDDWLITPLVSGILSGANLSWEAVARDPAYPDGYQVWVTSTIAGATPVITDFTTNGTMVFSIAAEDTSFVPHTVSLTPFAGQNIYIGFRNNSTDKFILEVDDIVIENPCVTVTLTTTNSTTNAGCGLSDGTATSVPSGGASPYTFLWDAAAAGQTTATATGLAAGSYMFTYTDNNGVSATSSVVVSNPNSPVGSTSVTSNYNGEDVSCNGSTDGIATASATGGTGAYTFTWDAAAGSQTTAIATGLGAGTYQVTITDGASCSGLDTVIVTEPSVLTTAIDSSSNVSCNGGSDGYIEISATGGTGAYTYAWSNSGNTSIITGLTANTYTGTVTDANGCTANTAITITEPSALVISLDSSNNVSCNGGADGYIEISATGGTGAYTYAWSNSGNTPIMTGLAANTYTGTVTDVNGCTASTSVTITEPTTVAAGIADNGDGTATASGTGGSGAYTFLWDATAGNQMTATATGLINNSTYGVTITDANGCTDTSSVTITIVGLEHIAGLASLNLFPNPTNANVFVDLDLSTTLDVTVRIMNTTGQRVLERELGSIQSKRIELPTNGFASGLYLVQFVMDNQTITRKLIVNRQ